MTVFQRIGNILAGIAMIVCSVLIMQHTEFGYAFISLIISLSFIIMGGKDLIYYFSLARHMVGGRRILYTGIIILDLGIFSATMVTNSTVYIILYILVIHIFSGIVDILGALEAKQMSAPSWRMKFSSGIVNIGVGVAAFVFGLLLKSVSIVVYIYCAGLIYSGMIRIISAFRRTSVVFIQ